MPIVKYFKKKDGNRVIGITELNFINGYKKEYLLGEILVNYIEFDYEIALESIRGLMDFVLKTIKPDLTIDKLKEFLKIDMFDLERLNNWDTDFEFLKIKNEKHFNDSVYEIKKIIKGFTKINPIYMEYLAELEFYLKQIETINAISLLDFLLKVEGDISNDKKLALRYKTAIDHCLYKEGINNDLTPKIRFLIYMNSDYITDRIEFKKLSYIDNIKKVKKKKTKLTGVEWNDNDYSFYQVYVTNLEETLYLEFRYLLINEVTLKKCQNCEKYFVSTARSKNLLYCNRKISGSNKTCEDVGSMNVYQKKAQDDPILAIWRKAKDRNRKREENEKITPDEYKNWVVYGGEIKDKTEKGEISYSEFEEIMNYNIEDTKRWIKTIKEGKEGE
jgi:hypothetical protein